jgi:hypothetical protein
MNAAVDACEAAEGLQLQEADRAQPTGTDGVVVWDVLTSAWTYPENTRYSVVRARHHLGDDAPYRPELARILQEVSGVCAELVGAARLDAPISQAEGAQVPLSIRKLVQQLAAWYPKHMVPQLTQAAALRPRSDSPQA